MRNRKTWLLLVRPSPVALFLALFRDHGLRVCDRGYERLLLLGRMNCENYLWILAVYAVSCVVAYFGNRRFMYFPDPARTPPAEAGLDSIEEVEIATSDGVTLVAWHASAKADKPTILYFHGNGANAANRASKIDAILESGFGHFLP